MIDVMGGERTFGVRSSQRTKPSRAQEARRVVVHLETFIPVASVGCTLLEDKTMWCHPERPRKYKPNKYIRKGEEMQT